MRGNKSFLKGQPKNSWPFVFYTAYSLFIASGKYDIARVFAALAKS
jgi:hypothetical protein